MSSNRRRYVISEFDRLHVMKAYWMVEVHAPLISFTLEHVLSAPTEYEAGWIAGPL